MRQSQTARLCTIALLLAAEIVLTRFCSISTPILRMSFGFLPISVVAVLYGPIAAGITYALGDLLGAVLFPIGPYFPGFTLTAFISGVIFGLFLYKKDITWKRSLPASVIVVLALDLALNTYWLKVLYGYGFIAMLPARLLKVVFAIPVETLLIPLVYNKIVKRIARL